MQLESSSCSLVCCGSQQSCAFRVLLAQQTHELPSALGGPTAPLSDPALQIVYIQHALLFVLPFTVPTSDVLPLLVVVLLGVQDRAVVACMGPAQLRCRFDVIGCLDAVKHKQHAAL